MRDAQIFHERRLVNKTIPESTTRSYLLRRERRLKTNRVVNARTVVGVQCKRASSVPGGSSFSLEDEAKVILLLYCRDKSPRVQNL